jgi:predicted DNA-binding transcriptional regulator YafY
MKNDRSSLRFTLQLLNKLMSGELITVQETLKHSSFKEAAVRRCLESLRKTIPQIEVKSGKPQIWSFKWPDQYISDAFSILTLKLARSLLSFLRGSELDAKLSEILMEHLQRDTTSMGPLDISRMFFAKSRTIKPFGIKTDTVDVLVKSIFEQTYVKAVYQQFDGKVNSIKIEPYSLIFSDEALYCYAKCSNSDKTDHIDTYRLYHLGRFQIIKQLKERFLYPERDEYDPEKLFQNCFGAFLPNNKDQQPQNIVCKFAPKWKSYLYNHRWHESQSAAVELDDGYVQISFYLYITPDLIRWLRSFGSELEILFPEELRKTL